MVDFNALAAPFPPASISWRVGSTNKDKTKGMALAYIDARDVMDRLDAVVGPSAWSNTYDTQGPRVICTLSIKVGDEWVAKSDGAGDTDVEAEKGALSDAFKRAAVKWGIGRYLYGIASPWVAIEQAGRSYKIADREYARLSKVLPGSVIAAPAADEQAGEGNPFAPDEAEIERDELIRLVNGCRSLDDLVSLWKSARVVSFFRTADPSISDPVTAAKDARKAALPAKQRAA